VDKLTVTLLLKLAQVSGMYPVIFNMYTYHTLMMDTLFWSWIVQFANKVVWWPCTHRRNIF